MSECVRIVYDKGPGYMGSAARVVLPDGTVLPGVSLIEIEPLGFGRPVTARITIACNLDIAVEVESITKVSRG